tara:strand:- start:4853 stop:5236 length:384 start_codon:yes stop_codon:yes gene_type:complete
MKIYGVGTDIVKIKRIKDSIKKESFITRIFNDVEISKCNKTIKRYNCYAKRFAAKEAFSKALGTGISKGINFNEIVVLNEKNGKPFIKLLKKTKEKVEKKLKKKKFKISLSLTDEDKYAVAFVTISI